MTPAVEQIQAVPTTAGSGIRARANGQRVIRIWELGRDQHWYAAGPARGGDGRWMVVSYRRSVSDLNLVEVLYVASDDENAVGGP